MFSEADPAQEILRKNALMDLEQLFIKSKFMPDLPEFQDAEEIQEEINIPNKQAIKFTFVEANFEQALNIINRAKAIDPEGTRKAVTGLLKKYHKVMLEILYDDLTSYMNSRY